MVLKRPNNTNDIKKKKVWKTYLKDQTSTAHRVLELRKIYKQERVFLNVSKVIKSERNPTTEWKLWVFNKKWLLVTSESVALVDSWVKGLN